MAKLEKDPDTPYLGFIRLSGSEYGPLMGILAGGYYFHNIALVVCKDARNPENNVRDVFLGFLFTCLTYIISGITGYYGYVGSAFAFSINAEDNTTHEIEENSLNMFKTNSLLGTIIRISDILQLIAVYVMVTSLERAQILLLFTGKQ